MKNQDLSVATQSHGRHPAALLMCMAFFTFWGCYQQIPSEGTTLDLLAIGDSLVAEQAFALSDSCFEAGLAQVGQFEGSAENARGHRVCDIDSTEGFMAMLTSSCFRSRLDKAGLGSLRAVWGCGRETVTGKLVRSVFMVDTLQAVRAISPEAIRYRKSRTSGHDIIFGLRQQDSKLIEEFTTKNTGRQVAVCIANMVFGVPKITQPVSSRSLMLWVSDKELNELMETIAIAARTAEQN